LKAWRVQTARFSLFANSTKLDALASRLASHGELASHQLAMTLNKISEAENLSHFI